MCPIQRCSRQAVYSLFLERYTPLFDTFRGCRCAFLTRQRSGGILPRVWTDWFHHILSEGTVDNMNKLLTKTNGMIGALLGIIVAIVGVILWVATSHHKTGIGLLVIGIIILAVGAYAYLAAGKTASAG